MMVLLSILQEMGLGTKTGAACFVVGLLETESMASALFVVVETRGNHFVLITVLPFNFDPSVRIILPLNILCPCAPSFALRILCACIPTQFRRKLVVWLESHLKLVADGFETVSLVFFVPHAFVQDNTMGLLALEFLAVGAGFLCGCIDVVLLLFLLLLAA
jgi:hypothetical protein